MFIFLIPLWAGFALVGASAFTAAYSRLLGERGGQTATVILRNFLGIPLFFYGFVMAFVAPAPFLFTPVAATMVIGWLLIAAGSIPFFWGHFIIGRPTHMPSVGDALVRHSLYAYVRHPIYSGGLVMLAGLSLVWPKLTFVIASISGFVWLFIQAKVEEIDLLQRMPEYREYMKEVHSRFLPGFGKRART